MANYPFAPRAYLELFAQESVAFLSAFRRSELDRDVSTCEGWTVAALGRHLGSIFERVEKIVRTVSTTDVDHSELLAVTDDEIAPYLERGASELRAVFEKADPNEKVWTYAGVAPVSLWLRRITHETMMHTFDLELLAPPMHEPPLSTLGDGVDEFLTAQLMRKLPRINAEGLSGRLALSANDTGDRWAVELTPTSARLLTDDELVDTECSGDARALLLYLWNRIDEDAIDVRGDRGLLRTYKEKVKL